MGKTYAISDIHGCYDKYINLLDKIGFSDDDTLYVLGDVIDREDGGIKTLCDMMTRKNVIPLIGNHEVSFCKYSHEQYLKRLKNRFYMRRFDEWLSDGGKPTYDAYKALSDEERAKVTDYVNSFANYVLTSVGGRRFLLAHTVRERGLMPDDLNALGEMAAMDFILGEPEYEKVYYPDLTIVTGHTPTQWIDRASRGKIWCGNNHIAIDCGASFGNPLGCLCLDTLEEFYAE